MRLTLGAIPEGDVGAVLTLEVMRRLVRQAAADAGLVAYARQLIAMPGAPADETVEAIRDFVQKRTRYTADPVGTEFLQPPALMLAQFQERGAMTGDCDDVAVLIAFLGVAHGLAYRFRAVGFRETGGELAHVFTLLRTPTGWDTLDVTRNPNQATAPVVRVVDG